MKKSLPIFVLLLALTLQTTLFAQQLPLFSQYRENNGILNPASVSNIFHTSDDNLNVGISYRQQWIGLDGAPTTQTVRAEYIGTSSDNVNILTGGYIMNDQTGPTGFTGAYGRIGAIFSSDPTESGLSVGLTVGVVQYRVNTSKLRLRDAGDIEATNDQKKIFPDAGLGIYYYKKLSGERGKLNGNTIYGGLSVPQVIGLDVNYTDNTGKFTTKRIQHFYGLLGFIYGMGDGAYLEPSAWIKYAPNAPINVDLNLKYQLNPTFWLGAGYSTASMLHAEAGVTLGENIGWDENHLRIGYGYDYSFRTFGPYAGSTHEINVSYSLNTNNRR